MEAMPTPDVYPASLTFDPPERIANWRPLVQWLLALPHLVVLSALRTLVETLAVISWFVIIFTGRLPDGIAKVQAMHLRYQARVALYTEFLQEEYPPFAYDTSSTDPGDVARLRVDLQPELEDRNRVTVGFRLILAIPHAVVLLALWIAAAVIIIVGLFAVLFTGRWPAGLRAFVLNVIRYQLRFEAYLALLTDRYPPFTLA
jgi:hypothetical protein